MTSRVLNGWPALTDDPRLHHWVTGAAGSKWICTCGKSIKTTDPEVLRGFVIEHRHQEAV